MSPKRLFTEHPEAVGETYLQHMGVALSFALTLLRAGLAALVHAFLPFLCVTTASTVVKRLQARMANRAPHPVETVQDRMMGWDPAI